MPRRTILTLVAATAAATSLALPATAGARLPKEFFGLEPKDVVAGKDAYRAEQLARQSAIGVRVMRVLFSWKAVEQKPDQFRASIYDGLVGVAAQNGIRLLPILADPPAFRSSRPPGSLDGRMYPPVHFSDLGTFGAAMAERYGPFGTYWVEHPEIPKLPIRAWQVWNEPHLPAFWPSGPNPHAYVYMLRVVGAAIKRVDPGAQIVTAGISDSFLPGAIRMRPFVSALYAARGRGAFDVLAIHPYARRVSRAIGLLRSVRRLMNRHHDSRTPIWVTEIGWASAGDRTMFTTTEQGQAQRVRDFIRKAVALRRQLRLKGVIYYQWRDPDPSLGPCWCVHTGLLRDDLTPKPAYWAFRRAISAAERG